MASAMRWTTSLGTFFWAGPGDGWGSGSGSGTGAGAGSAVFFRLFLAVLAGTGSVLGAGAGSAAWAASCSALARASLASARMTSI